MAQTIAANEVTLRELRESFGLELTEDANFFSEWSVANMTLSQPEQQFLDRSSQGKLRRTDGRSADAGEQRQNGGTCAVAGFGWVLSQAVSD